MSCVSLPKSTTPVNGGLWSVTVTGSSEAGPLSYRGKSSGRLGIPCGIERTWPERPKFLWRSKWISCIGATRVYVVVFPGQSLVPRFVCLQVVVACFPRFLVLSLSSPMFCIASPLLSLSLSEHSNSAIFRGILLCCFSPAREAMGFLLQKTMSCPCALSRQVAGAGWRCWCWCCELAAGGGNRLLVLGARCRCWC